MKRIRLLRIRLLILASVVNLLLSGCAQWAAFPQTEAQVQAATPQLPAPEIQRWQTAEGAKVLFVHNPALAMLDIRLVMDAGSARDNGSPGVASMTSALIGEGAEGLSVDDIARGFEDHGAVFSVGSYRDMGIIDLRTLSDAEYQAPVLDLFTRVIGTPTFPQQELDRLREQILQGMRMEQQVPGPQVGKAFMATLYAGHPYGTPSDGDLDSLPTIKRAQLVEFYQQYYAAGNSVIAIVGDASLAQAQAIAARISAALPAGPAAPDLPRAVPLTERKTQHITFPSTQTHILLGNQTTWRGNPDHVALYVGNMILGGGGFASILTDEVRQKRGYVYGIGSGFTPMAAGGAFQVQFKTANDNADDALTLTLQLIDDFAQNGPTQAQLDETRTNIQGSFALGLASNGDLLGHLGSIGFYDLPNDYLTWFSQQVNSMTTDTIRDAFQRTVDADALAIVSIGPQAPQVIAVPPASGGPSQSDAPDGEE